MGMWGLDDGVGDRGRGEQEAATEGCGLGCMGDLLGQFRGGAERGWDGPDSAEVTSAALVGAFPSFDRVLDARHELLGAGRVLAGICQILLGLRQFFVQGYQVFVGHASRAPLDDCVWGTRGHGSRELSWLPYRYAFVTGRVVTVILLVDK